MAKALTTLTLIVAVTAGPALAQNGGGILDRIEDRIDRRESLRDEAVTLGPRDRLEDIIDRRESRRDRAGLDSPRFINRWERRSWRRIWRNREGAEN